VERVCQGSRWQAKGFTTSWVATSPLQSLQLSSAHGIYAELHEVNFQSLPLPFADNAVDTLTCVGVLTYVKNTV
jgi:hypothetical protein